jgi:hypothetical protein
MNSEGSSPSLRAFTALREFASKPAPAERCDLCSVGLGPEHQHLIEPVGRKLLCTCEACAVLFSAQSRTKYRRVPRRVRLLVDFRLSDAQWDGLMLPINMAFFFRSSPEGRVMALYPSPAGPTESLLPLESWDELVQENQVLVDMEPDVEGLLANRLGHVRGYSKPEYYVAPIDECYRLVGLIRANWRGLSGGTEVWREIAAFFNHLRDKAVFSRGSGRA